MLSHAYWDFGQHLGCVMDRNASCTSREPMNYSAIRTCDVANGPGVRVSLFVSGCTHCCPGCFNPDTWDFAAGEPWTDAVQEKVLASCEPDWIQGLSLLGGEPFEPPNQRALVPLLRAFRARFPKKDVWAPS